MVVMTRALLYYFIAAVSCAVVREGSRIMSDKVRTWPSESTGGTSGIIVNAGMASTIEGDDGSTVAEPTYESRLGHQRHRWRCVGSSHYHLNAGWLTTFGGLCVASVRESHSSTCA